MTGPSVAGSILRLCMWDIAHHHYAQLRRADVAVREWSRSFDACRALRVYDALPGRYEARGRRFLHSCEMLRDCGRVCGTCSRTRGLHVERLPCTLHTGTRGLFNQPFVHYDATDSGLG